MSLKVDIVTPEKIMFSGVVDMITLPGSTGQMGIYGGHAPLLTTMDVGNRAAQWPATSTLRSAAAWRMHPDKVTIAADVAEEPSVEIDKSPRRSGPRSGAGIARHESPAQPAPGARGADPAQHAAAEGGATPRRPAPERGAELRRQPGSGGNFLTNWTSPAALRLGGIANRK